MLQKMVINKIVDLISKQFKLYDIMKYVKDKWKNENFIEQDYADAACIALYGLKQDEESKDYAST